MIATSQVTVTVEDCGGTHLSHTEVPRRVPHRYSCSFQQDQHMIPRSGMGQSCIHPHLGTVRRRGWLKPDCDHPEPGHMGALSSLPATRGTPSPMYRSLTCLTGGPSVSSLTHTYSRAALCLALATILTHFVVTWRLGYKQGKVDRILESWPQWADGQKSLKISTEPHS